MKESKPLDATALLEEAKASEHGEAYRTLDKDQNFRIGVGLRLKLPKQPYFFVEILIYLCPTFKKTDLDVLEKSLNCLKELKAKNYTLTCEDSNCVSSEKVVTAANLVEEYREAKALMKASFG